MATDSQTNGGVDRSPGRRWHATGGLLALVLLLAACTSSPTDAYLRMVAAAKMDDREGFVGAFTEGSRNLIAALLELNDAYGPQTEDPYRLLVFTEVVGEERGEPEARPGTSGEQREVAFVTVSAGGKKRRIKMVLEDSDWRIDALDLEAFWAERENFRF